jgi:hypothetical protein
MNSWADFRDNQKTWEVLGQKVQITWTIYEGSRTRSISKGKIHGKGMKFQWLFISL